jgi:hypothetical protein
MAYVVRPGEGLHFSTPLFPNCVVASYDTGGVGELVFVGTAPLGSIEYDAVAVIWGPGDLGSQGDAGPFLMSLLPAANAAIAALEATVHDAPLQQHDPCNVPNINKGLRQFFKVVNGQVVFSPYN